MAEPARPSSTGLYLIKKQDGQVEMLLAYTVDGEPRQQTVPITYTSTPFGERPWWQCCAAAGAVSGSTTPAAGFVDNVAR